MAGPIVYVDRSAIRKGSLEDLRKGVAALVAWIEEREPQLIVYSFFFNPDETEMAVVAVHPDSASLELHLEIGGPEFRKLAGFLDLRSIDVYGEPSEFVRTQLQQKAEMLGEGGRVTVHRLQSGFDRYRP